jgi:hypothetical protein
MEELFNDSLSQKELKALIKKVVKEDSPTQGDAIHVGWNAVCGSVEPEEGADEEWLEDTVSRFKRAAKIGGKSKNKKAKKATPNISLLLKKMEASCSVKKSVKAPTTELEKYTVQALEKLNQCSEAKRQILRGWYATIHGGTEDKTFYKMITKGGLHKLRFLDDDCLIPSILENSKKIVSQADPDFWEDEEEIPMIQIGKKKIVRLDWLMQ